MQRRVVITGLGVVAPNGIGKEHFWHACLSGNSSIRRITRFDPSLLSSQIAGEVQDFDPEALGLTYAEVSHVDRGTQFSIAAANLALRDARLLDTLSADERDEMGVYVGSTMACIEEGEKLWVKVTDRGTHAPRVPTDGAELVPPTMFMPHAPAAAIAMHHQLHGPCTVIATGCSAGADAIGEAFWAIQEGRVDRMLAGGTDSAISYSSMNVFCILGALSTRNDDPQRASRPL